MLGLLAFLGPAEIGEPLASGLWIGFMSQGISTFGGLILLDARENTLGVPVSRASSILARAASPTRARCRGLGWWLPPLLVLTLEPRHGVRSVQT